MADLSRMGDEPLDRTPRMGPVGENNWAGWMDKVGPTKTPTAGKH